MRDKLDAPVGSTPGHSLIRLERAKFTVPDRLQIFAFHACVCEERNNRLNAQNFIDHYQANGWIRGKTKIKDWKACSEAVVPGGLVVLDDASLKTEYKPLLFSSAGHPGRRGGKARLGRHFTPGVEAEVRADQLLVARRQSIMLLLKGEKMKETVVSLPEEP